MKFKLKEIPEYGKERIVKRFLLFPKEISREVRWLEKAKIKQRAIVSSAGDYAELICWEDLEWVDSAYD